MKKLLLTLLVAFTFGTGNAQTMTIINHVTECDVMVEIFRDYPIGAGMPSNLLTSGIFAVTPASTTVIGAGSLVNWRDGGGVRTAWDPRMVFSHITVSNVCTPVFSTTVGGPQNGAITTWATGLPLSGNFTGPSACPVCANHNYTVTWTDMGVSGVQVDIY